MFILYLNLSYVLNPTVRRYSHHPFLMFPPLKNSTTDKESILLYQGKVNVFSGSMLATKCEIELCCCHSFCHLPFENPCLSVERNGISHEFIPCLNRKTIGLSRDKKVNRWIWIEIMTMRTVCHEFWCLFRWHKSQPCMILWKVPLTAHEINVPILCHRNWIPQQSLFVS
jgi:hypothetical protein